MIHTPVCDLLGITHPIVLGGMATGTSVPLVAAVSNTGGLGILGVTGQSAAEIQRADRGHSCGNDEAVWGEFPALLNQ